VNLRSWIRHYKHVIQITGFVSATIAIYTFCTTPVGRLQAEIYYADFELPPGVAQQLAALAPLTASQTARAEFFRPGLRHRILPDTSGTVDQVLGSVAEFVNEKAPGVASRRDFLYKGYWKINVHNPGTRAVSNVVVRLPVAASAVISRSTAERGALQDLPPATAQMFTLGNIQGSDDGVVLHAWTLEAPTPALAAQITITHDLGRAATRIVR
jgi:hypothetical protein